MPNLTVIRHSLAIANEQGILMGAKLDSPLSDEGQKVAIAKGRALKAQNYLPDKVFTSKLTRARQTAQIILQELGIETGIIELESLNERDFGNYDGKPYRFVLEAFEKHGDNPPSVEPVELFVGRVVKALEAIKQETNGNTLVVTHSNPEMVMQTALFNPDNLNRFWELGDPPHCEGFSYDF